MDLWVVAAAAGVGYAAKANYLKNSTSRITESSLKACSCGLYDPSDPQNLLQKFGGKTCPLCRFPAIRGAVSSITDTSYEKVQFQNRRALPEFTTEEPGSFPRLSKGRKLKNKFDGNILKPIDVTESWLTVDLYGEQNAEDYVNTPPSSPSARIDRALTIGSFISKSSSHDCRKGMKPTQTQYEPFTWRGLSRSDLLIFFEGIAIGILLDIAYSTAEVNNLHEQLKKNENLVDDLYKKLETRDQESLEELANEGIENEELGILKKSEDYKSEEMFDKKPKNSEVMSKIEAELQAELEMLEVTLKSSSLGGNFDIEQQSLSDTDHEESGSSSGHIESGNYTVSPQELRLRLHKVIEERLQARIIELEAALESSEKRLRELESQ